MNLRLFVVLFQLHLGLAQYVWRDNITVNPEDTDPAITRNQLPVSGYGDHKVWNQPSLANCAAGGGCGLFVYLSGSYGQPRHTTYMQNTASLLGFHVIGLAYSNADSVENMCASYTGAAQQTCQHATRTEVILGENITGSVLPVNFANGIVNRLWKLLKYLDDQEPSLGWDRYYIGTTPSSSNLRWEKMTIGGHSQGGGTAQIIGSMFPVTRVLKMAGGVYLNPATYPPFEFTTNAAYFTFTNVNDPLFNGVQVVDKFTLQMGAFGAVVDVDTASPPYVNTHMLSSSINGTYAHSCVSSDFALVFNATTGAPVYDPVWRYMMGVPSHDQTTPGRPTATYWPTTPTSTASAAASVATNSLTVGALLLLVGVSN